MKKPNIKNNLQSGFTIVELMIATLVFSVILLVITYGVLHFTSDYYKGINSSATQNSARNAMDSITQAIQFGPPARTTPTVAGSGQFCAGNKILRYTLGIKYDGTPPGSGNWGLFMQTNNAAGCNPVGATENTELLSKNMRVTDVSNTQISPQLWHVSLKIAYGDADLLCKTSITDGSKGDCSQGAASYTATDVIAGSDVQCKLQAGSQFCSVAVLQTTVQQRIVD